ncbi:gamma-aminobutyric acid receptor subunit beta-4 isoform X3 [Nematostella vectensis]|uniref:gamma-aminobutyric acid receptor subunit beta-4 isoform X3 n=1 Tax=Nematostella vectensis TaxID=45351 RepID=UPI002077852E|nr:gamma-aminobutyric acid receptor subunit beta-4 isoform X3 [Nematostella vectensis]XP_048579379.1 gamma-aminobutyric acid receptor subunit beta-4 isoform X3 [Nematostella vectensis]
MACRMSKTRYFLQEWIFKGDKMKLILLLGLFYMVECYSNPSPNSSNQTVSRILDSILTAEKYDKRLRPNYGAGPVIVTVGFWVLSIDTINVVDMDYTLDIFLRQSWVDERLSHDLNTTMFLSNTVMDKIWLPDSYFVNAKQGSFHKVTKDNMMVMIQPDGQVQYNARVTIRASCPMNLRKFPMDTQHCPLTLESYGYSSDHIVFKWEIEDGDGLGFVPESLKMLPQYKLARVHLSTLHNEYVVGNWSGIKALFTFERMYSYFVIHVYGPCALIVVVSWVSFLLPKEQAPARITLGVTSVLTVVTILNMLNNSMPKVNYVKTIDKYLIGCFLFVFATLVEYSLVLWLTKSYKKYNKAKEELSKSRGKSHPFDEQYDGDRNTQIALMDMPHENDVVVEMNGRHAAPRHRKIRCQSPQEPSIRCEPIKRTLLNEAFVQHVDEYALVLFPGSFVIFNAVYWFSVMSFDQIFGS